MSETVIVAIISFVGTIAGSLMGVIATSKLLNYRVDKLEEKVEDIEQIRERINKCEETNQVQNTKLQYISNQLDENKEKIDKLLERVPANA